MLPFANDGLQSLGSVGALRLLHWKQKGWIRLLGEVQNKGLQAVAELQAPDTNDFMCPCVFAYAQMPLTAEVGSVITIRMAVYLRVAVFGLSANEATRHLLEAVQHQHCHGGVIPTRALPQSTNKYTRSDQEPSHVEEDKKGKGEGVEMDVKERKGQYSSPVVLRAALPHSSTVYAQFSKDRANAPSCSSSTSSSSSSLSSCKPSREIEVVDLVCSDEEKEEKVPPLLVKSEPGIGNTALNEVAGSSSVSPLAPDASLPLPSPHPKLDFSTRSLLCAAECTGYPLGDSGKGGELLQQPHGLAPGLVLRDYQVCHS